MENGSKQMELDASIPLAALDDFAGKGSDAPDKAARFLKSLAHRDRLKLLCTLIEGELSVSDIEVKLGSSQPAVSQHLARLREEGIVRSRRVGRQILYEIADPIVFGMISLLYLRFCGEPTD